MRAQETMASAFARELSECPPSARQSPFWQDVFERSTIGIALLSPDGTIIRCVNPAFASMHGYAPAELGEASTRRVVSSGEHDKGDLAAPIPGECLTFESAHVRKDGGTFPVSVHVSMVIGGDERAMSRVAYVRRAPAPAEPDFALWSSEERLRLLVEHTTDRAFLTLDRGGRILSWNEGAERLEGYRPEEILGEHLRRLYPPEDVAAGRPEAVLAAVARRGRLEFEAVHLRPDGHRFRVFVELTALRDRNGQLLGFGEVIRGANEATSLATAARVQNPSATEIEKWTQRSPRDMVKDLRRRLADGLRTVIELGPLADPFVQRARSTCARFERQ